MKKTKTLLLSILLILSLCSAAAAEAPVCKDIGQFRFTFPTDFYDVSEAYKMEMYANKAGSYFCPVYQDGSFSHLLTGTEEEVFQRIQDTLIAPTTKSCVRLCAEYSGGCHKVACVTVGDLIGYTIAVVTDDGLLVGMADKECLDLMQFWVKSVFAIK